MPLADLARTENERRIRHAAMVAAFLGLATIVNGLVVAVNGAPLGGWITGAVGAMQLALAWGVHRRSRAAAVAVVVLFAADRAVALATLGPVFGVVLWTVIFGVVLFTGMRAVFSASAFATAPRAPR